MKAIGQILSLLICLLAVAIADSCTEQGHGNAVPKPEGWPRLTLPDNSYTARTVGPARLCFNSEATIGIDRKDDASWWITVTYPQFRNATLYLTLSATSPAEFEKKLGNRRERMELNAGTATTIITELTSAGNWHCELAETVTSLTTPVQLLATDSINILSGAFYLNLPPGSSPDSIAPMVRAVRDDMLYLLKNCADE